MLIDFAERSCGEHSLREGKVL